MRQWLSEIEGSSAVHRLAVWADAGGSASVRGISGSSTTIAAAAVRRRTDRPILLVTAHLDDADEAADELTGLGIDAARLPAMELVPGETAVSLELLGERLTLVKRLLDGHEPDIIAAPVQALMQGVPDADALPLLLRIVRPGDTLVAEDFVRWLDAAGYTRVDAIETPGEFAVRGGIIDIYAPGGEPVRIDLFGDEVDALCEIDLDSMGSDCRLEQVQLTGAVPAEIGGEQLGTSFASLLPRQTVSLLADVAEITEQGRSYYQRIADPTGIAQPSEVFRALAEHSHAVVEVHRHAPGAAPDRTVDLPVRPLMTFNESASDAVGELAELAETHEVWVLCQNDGEAQRMHELRDEFAPDTDLTIETRYLHRGLVWEGDGDARPLALVPCHELLHRYGVRRRLRRVTTNRAIDSFIDVQPGDFVVHRDHGIARFTGLHALAPTPGDGRVSSDAAEEFLTLEFANGAKMHVPATKAHLVQKYVGAFKGTPELSALGGKRWQNQKESVKEGVRELAAEMLRIQAAREATHGTRFPIDSTWQREFAAEFPYDETEDQLTAINAVNRDMAAERPMDRLICGDVGFGKTEIAIRAAFKAAEYGKQVAVLVPTTVLAEQHERTFRERFGGYPFRIDSVSRFKSAGDAKRVLDDLRKGQVDIIIGTHRLLSRDVHFADLGLVVIDEEQRFGVEHKHKLLQFRATADVLTMSATPIPRTLHMSLLGLRDISSLTTPPLDRRAIVTEVISYDSRRIQQAIERELAREGQVFFVHNRVHNIDAIAQEVQALAPDARVLVGHGQMPGRKLESIMRRFIRREADILVCTTIIESGIDIPTANTMFINDADMFGLAELHQLRGRVGRHKHRAYCYLMLSPDKVVSEVALKRLRALESFSMLGAGFKIALRDLELRGAGNLLGAEQSGHIAAVGYEMYCQLLEQAVKELRSGRPATLVETTVEIGITGTLPKGYIPSDSRRIDAYRRLSSAMTLDEVHEIEHDLHSAYGELPKAAERLLALAEIRASAAALGVRSVLRREGDIVFRATRPAELEKAFGGAKGTVRMVGNVSETGIIEVYYRPPKQYLEPQTLLSVLRHRLRSVAKQDPSHQAERAAATG